MPVVITSRIEFDNTKGYYIDLSELSQTFPHVKEDKEIEFYLIELRNEQDKLIKRFKPFEKFNLKTSSYWESIFKEWILCLPLAVVASRFNVGKSYKVTVIITRYDGKEFVPLEVRGVGSGSQKALEYFSKIEEDLLSLSLEQPVLKKAVSYLWDSHSRLEENDIEGARVAIRNSLKILKEELVPRIIVQKGEESGEFPKRIEKLLGVITEFLHYGGPHPGPAPRTTTEMSLSLTTDIVRYLAKLIESKVIHLSESE